MHELKLYDKCYFGEKAAMMSTIIAIGSVRNDSRPSPTRLSLTVKPIALSDPTIARGPVPRIIIQAPAFSNALRLSVGWLLALISIPFIAHKISIITIRFKILSFAVVYFRYLIA